jgi:hypothetical protein
MKKINLILLMLACLSTTFYANAQTACGTKNIAITLSGIAHTGAGDGSVFGCLDTEGAVSSVTANHPLSGGAPSIGEKFCNYYNAGCNETGPLATGESQFAAFNFIEPTGCVGGSGNLPNYITVEYELNEDDGFSDDCDYDPSTDEDYCVSSNNISLASLISGSVMNDGTVVQNVTCGPWILQFTIVVTGFTPGSGDICASPIKICTDASLTFNAEINGTAESGNNYGCLTTYPRPTWFYLETGVAGNIDMSLAASADVDFALWGPYANLAAATAACGTLPAPIDCSYSTSATEAINIPTSTVGEVWLMVVTNYAGTVQTFSLSKTGGTGDTDCTGVSCPDGEVTADVDPYSGGGTGTDCNSDGTITFHLTITNPASYTGPFTVQYGATASGSGPVGLAADPTTLAGPIIDIIATDPDPATADAGYPGNVPASDDAITAIGNVRIFDANGCEVTGLNGFASWDLAYDKLVDCPEQLDCTTAPIITCGQSTTTTLVGAGAWNVTSCGFSTPGTEAVYRFTSTLAGTYSLNITSASGGYIDYAFKLASGTCDATGWTCIDDNNATGTDVFTLAANTDYYILLDPEATTSMTHTWNISCPVPPPFNCQAIETAVTTADINAACGAAALNFTPTVTYGGGTPVLDGALASTDPTFNRPSSGTPPTILSGTGTSVYYDAISFQVTTTGSYTFTNTAPFDGFGVFYQTSFSPASPLTNALDADDDTNGNDPVHVVTLTAGVTYILVTTSFYNGDTGSYTWTVSGPGSLAPIAPTTGEPVVAGYAYTYTITNSAGNIVGIDAAPVDMTAYAEGTYSVCGLHYPTSGFVLPLTDGTVNYATWAATLTDASNATCADVSTDCITVTITCAPACPTLTAQAPAAVVSSESTCSDCALSGGVIAAPSTTCPAGSTLQYSTNGGTTWSSVLPTYNQTTAVTVMTRCNCDVDNTQSSPTNSVTTAPGTCTAVSATAGDNDPACGGTLNLTASGGASYAWTGPNSFTSTAQNPTISNVNGTHDGVYTVVVTGANGCSASANTTVNTITCSGTRTLTIVDPCSCNNDASTSIDGTPTLPVVNGTFDEVVQVDGLIAGDVVTVTAISGLYSAPGVAYTTATATAATVTAIPTATLQGIHVDNVGYSITFHVSNTTPGFEFEGDISIANKCAYPNPDFTIGSFVDCSTPIAITLTHSALEGAGNLGSASFSPTLGGTSPNYTLSPAGLTGTQTITLTYTGFNDGNGGIAPGGPYIDPTAITTPAFPGCQEVIQKTTTVNCPGCAASGTMQWNP